MKFALVGIGKWGKTYLRTMKEISGSQIIATCSQSKEAFFSNENPELFTAPHFYNIKDMLNEVPIDTLIIATHPDSHYKLAATALCYDKNVICEKPFMLSSDETGVIKRLLGKNIFFTDYTNIYHNIISQMQELKKSNAVKLETRKLKLTLINTGCGPCKAYSDLWDYGSHIASVIFYLFPDTDFDIKQMSRDKEGNHFLCMDSQEVEIEATFGNKSEERHHFFQLESGENSISWHNDRSENPLGVMLKNFAFNRVQSNIDFSKRIKDFLEMVNKLKI